MELNESRHLLNHSQTLKRRRGAHEEQRSRDAFGADIYHSCTTSHKQGYGFWLCLELPGTVTQRLEGLRGCRLGIWGGSIAAAERRGLLLDGAMVSAASTAQR